MGIGFHFYKLEIKKILSYRVEFWTGFLGNILTQFGIAFFLWKAIFLLRGGKELMGYAFGSLMMYFLLIPLVERCVQGQEGGSVSGEIYDGGLSRFLIYPINYFQMKFMEQLAQASVFFCQLVLVLFLVWVFSPQTFSLTLPVLGKSIIVIFVSGILHFSILINLEMVAFWADNVWSLSVLNRMVTHFLGGGLIPLAFFPDQVRKVLDLLPFSHLISFPVRCLLGQVNSGEWIRGIFITLIWSGIFGLTAAWAWRKGLSPYSGVGI